MGIGQGPGWLIRGSARPFVLLILVERIKKMAIGDGAHQTQKQLATAAGGLSAAVRVARSGADLMQAANAVQSGLPVGPTNDGAKMEQAKGGSGV